ncbi:hypothetical protein J6590_068806 [Homalodisca vitripennis]|nr:hypothetical protein J6590_068806 [Homalodisca vitripennis]
MGSLCQDIEELGKTMFWTECTQLIPAVLELFLHEMHMAKVLGEAKVIVWDQSTVAHKGRLLAERSRTYTDQNWLVCGITHHFWLVALDRLCQTCHEEHVPKSVEVSVLSTPCIAWHDGNKDRFDFRRAVPPAALPSCKCVDQSRATC